MHVHIVTRPAISQHSMRLYQTILVLFLLSVVVIFWWRCGGLRVIVLPRRSPAFSVYTATATSSVQINITKQKKCLNREDVHLFYT